MMDSWDAIQTKRLHILRLPCEIETNIKVPMTFLAPDTMKHRAVLYAESYESFIYLSERRNNTTSKAVRYIFAVIRHSIKSGIDMPHHRVDYITPWMREVTKFIKPYYKEKS